MSKYYSLLLNNQEYKIQFNLRLFNKLGESISQELINKGRYFVQSDVSNENFQVFLDILNDKIQNPELNYDNYYDYQLLSDEFNNNLSNYLSRQEFEHIKKISIVKNAKKDERLDKSSFEQYIAEHLDYYLEYFSKEMSEIPFTTLYNIFQHKNRILNNQERAYQFIKETLTKSDNDNDFNGNRKNICILLDTLDGTKMSEESLNESFSKKDENFGFAPKFGLSFVSELKNQMNSLMEQQVKMMKEIKSLFDEKINSVNENYQMLTKKLDDTNDQIKNLSQNVANIDNEVKGILANGEELKKNVDRIVSENSKAKTEIESLSQNVGKIGNEVKEISKEKTKTDDIYQMAIAKTGIFDGIIRKLSEECGGSVIEKGVVKVTAPNAQWGNLQNVVNFDNFGGSYGSISVTDANIKYDFINRKVCPICYLIRSSCWSKNDHHPKSWYIEGSNNDSNWTILDERRNCDAINEKKVVLCFPIQKPRQFYKYLRIRLIEDTNGAHHLCLSAIEFFGSIQ